MSQVKELKAILDVLVEAGKGTNWVYAEHDMIFLSPPGEIDENSELGEKLSAAGANYDDSEYGWYVNT